MLVSPNSPKRKAGRTSSIRRACSTAARSDGKIYCVPVNIHSPQWLWLSHAAFEKAGVAGSGQLGRIRRGRAETARSRHPAAGARPAALAVQPAVRRRPESASAGWTCGSRSTSRRTWKQPRARKWPRSSRPWRMPATWPTDPMSRTGTRPPTWVITGTAGGQIMGDWAQGEFQVANQYRRRGLFLPSRSRQPTEYLSTGGDAFYFPKLDDPEKAAAQLETGFDDDLEGGAGCLQPEKRVRCRSAAISTSLLPMTA